MYIDDPKATIANEKATSPAANGDMDASHTLLATDLGPKILIDIERPPREVLLSREKTMLCNK